MAHQKHAASVRVRTGTVPRKRSLTPRVAPASCHEAEVPDLLELCDALVIYDLQGELQED